MHSRAHGKPKLPGVRSFPNYRYLLIFFAAILLGFTSPGQNITISARNESLEKVLRLVEEQSPYRFVFSHNDLKQSKPVNLQVKNASIDRFLSLCFSDQPFLYKLDEQTIVLQLTEETMKNYPNAAIPLNGIINDETGAPIEGATISLSNHLQATASDEAGRFSFADIGNAKSLIISCIGFERKELAIDISGFMRIIMHKSVSQLDETMVMAYGTTTRRLGTGSITKITSEQIASQPVTNPLAALYARVPGLLITQSGGLPGAPFQIQVRGRTSIDESLSNDDPLVVIDGVPFGPNNNDLNILGPAAGGISPLSMINPADIESIEVLKDADATAIYGSRGAGGVILITTRKSKAGKTNVSLSMQNGWSSITRTMDMLNTQQYIEMRKEAFANDGVTPTATNAPDLVLWDTTRYTNLKELLIGGTAISNDIQASITGGSDFTQYGFNFGYNRQSTVFPGDLHINRGSLHSNLQHRSNDGRFQLSFKSGYAVTKDNTIRSDLTQHTRYAPNYPELYDSAGQLRWYEKGVNFDNPLAYLGWTYESNIKALYSNMNLRYRFRGGFGLSASMGYNETNTSEYTAIPSAARNPATINTGSSEFSRSLVNSWIIEPQADYFRRFGKNRISVLLGSTLQRTLSQFASLKGDGYTSDALLKDIGSAASVRAENGYSPYRYAALFGRLNLNHNDQFIINLTGRRDGSSRFGANRRFANFWAIGSAWIFSSYQVIKQQLPFLSFGKLRASYGLTGNDKIGDYQYLDTWNSIVGYSGTPSLFPFALYNPDLAWEEVRKLEAALELGFLNDRYLVTASWYRHRTNNGLISYTLPYQTGFTSVRKNWNALVQNSGWEIELMAQPVKIKNFSWSTSLNINLPKNKLLEFEGLANSSYYNKYLVGQPLSTFRGIPFAGVDPATGYYVFEKKDGSLTSAPNFTADAILGLAHRETSFYGGWNNSFSYRNFSISGLFEFRQSTGNNYMANSSYPIAGTMFNQPTVVLNRWRKPGDLTNIPRFTTTSGNPAFNAANSFRSLPTDGKLTDASFIRLKNLAVQYNLPQSITSRISATGVRIFVLMQNILTITGYKGTDPETQEYFTLPPLKTISAGIQVQF